MRQLFEAQGAVLSWNGSSKTVTATKNDTTLTYRIGEVTSTLNGKTLSLNVPGQIVEGNTMIPLRFVSEALGSTVKWDGLTRTIRIASTDDFFTTVLSGVNLRSKPDSSELPLPCGLFQPVKRFMSSARSMPSGWKYALKTT
nr:MULTISPECIES: copper amine oxidase N-terminal domain-containing protein [Paenibacillus]